MLIISFKMREKKTILINSILPLIYKNKYKEKKTNNCKKINTRKLLVMGIKGRRVHMIEELSETIISFQRGKTYKQRASTATAK